MGPSVWKSWAWCCGVFAFGACAGADDLDAPKGGEVTLGLLQADVLDGALEHATLDGGFADATAPDNGSSWNWPAHRPAIFEGGVESNREPVESVAPSVGASRWDLELSDEVARRERCGTDVECALGLGSNENDTNVVQTPAYREELTFATTDASSLSPMSFSAVAAVTSGTLPGTVEVTDDGQATYAIPLDVPIGLRGMAPSIGLRYQGSRHNALLGIGWGIDGLSAITRCSRTFGQDGWAGPIDDTSSDRFCLDGKRLVAIRGTYGAAGTEYRTEFETFSNVVSEGDPGSGTSYVGPLQFVVRAADGRIFTYGGTSATTELARGVRRTWVLRQIRDRHGNTIEYTYGNRVCDPPRPGAVAQCFNTALRPVSITYGTNPSVASTSPRRVQFVYSTDRGDRTSHYRRGEGYVSRHRLESIQVHVGDVHHQTYELSYEEIAGTSRMTAVRQCSEAAPRTCMQPTRFTYSARVQSWAATTIATQGTVHFGNGPRSRYIGRTIVLDHNGDGRDDLLLPRASSGRGGQTTYTYRVLLGRNDAAQPFATEIDTEIAAGMSSSSDLMPCFSSESVIDFNGDGRDDLVDLCNHLHHGWRVFIAVDGGFTTQRLNFLPTTYAKHDSLRVADLDGDGIEDLLLCEDGATTSTLKLYRGKGRAAGFDAPRTLPRLGEGCTDQVLSLLVDIDGDGVVNLMRPERDPYYDWLEVTGRFNPTPAWKALVIKGATAQWVDAGFAPPFVAPEWLPNPDEHPFSYAWESAIPTGNPFVQVEPVSPYAPFWQLKPLDFNGDGLTDLLHYRGDAATPQQRVSLYVNTGRGFTRVPLPFRVPSTWSWFEVDNYAFYRATVMDANGDGRDDLLMPIGDPLRPVRWVLLTATSQDGPFQGSLLSSQYPLDAYTAPVTLDHDGDGDGDLLIQGPDGTLRYVRGTMESQRLLESATNGLGERHTVAYGRTPAYTGSVFSPTPARDCSTNVLCPRRVQPLVGRVETFGSYIAQRNPADPPNTEFYKVQTETFSYSGAAVGLYGRGWLGFASVQRRLLNPQGTWVRTVRTSFDNAFFVDSLTGTTARRFYPRAGRPSRRVTSYPAVDDVDAGRVYRSETEILDWSVRISVDQRPFLTLDRRASTVAQAATLNALSPATIFKTEHSFSTNSYGMTTSEVWSRRTALNDLLESRNVRTTHEVTPARRTAWLIRLPDAVSVTSNTAGGSASRSESYEYNAIGALVATERQPGGSDSIWKRTTLVYDTVGNVTRSTEETRIGLTRSDVFSYDALRLTLRSHRRDTLTWSFDVDPIFGQLRTETDPNGIAVRRHEYDGFGRLRATATPDTRTTVTTRGNAFLNWDTRGRIVVESVTPGHGTVEEVYDSFGRLVQTRTIGYSNKWLSAERAYDWAGRLVKETRPHLVGDATQGEVTYEYDALGRLRFERRTDENAPGGVATSEFRYGLAPSTPPTAWTNSSRTHALERIEAIDPTGAVEITYLGHAGQPIAIRDAAGGFTQYLQGPFSLPRSIRDAHGNETRTTFDAWGRRTSLLDPNRGLESATYDAFDRITTTTLADGARLHYTYDAHDRTTEIRDADGSRTLFVYDGDGAAEKDALVEASTWSSTNELLTRTRYEYTGSGSGLGQLRRITRTAGGATMATSMTYDRHGRLDRLDYPAAPDHAFRVRYGYDDNGHVIAVSDAVSNQAYWRLTRDDQGYRIGTETFGNQTETTYAYQPRSGRLRSIGTLRTGGATETIQSLTYSYDARGYVRARTDGTSAARSRSYVHDALGRLTHVRRGTTELERIDYDALGNITFRTSVGAYEYNSSRPHAVTRAGDTQFTYDARGNQLVRAGSLVADRRQVLELTSFDLPKVVRSGAAGELVTQFTYDADRRRAHVRWASGGQTWYAGDLYEREEGVDETRHRYRVYGPDREIAQVEVSYASLAATPSGRTVRYLHADALGTPDAVTDETGALVGRPFVDPFGQEAGTLRGLGLTTGFTGHRHDHVLGLIDMKGRIYDPKLGRFLSADPVVQSPLKSQSLNRYSYAWNSPLRWTDPSGFETTCGKYKGQDYCGQAELSFLKKQEEGGNVGGEEMGGGGEIERGISNKGEFTRDAQRWVGGLANFFDGVLSGFNPFDDAVRSGPLGDGSPTVWQVGRAVGAAAGLALDALGMATGASLMGGGGIAVAGGGTVVVGVPAIAAGAALATASAVAATSHLLVFSQSAKGALQGGPPAPTGGTGAVGAGSDWPTLSGMLRDAAKGRGNFGIGSGTREQANAMGRAWVGKGYKTASDGKTLVSADRLRQYRPPSLKPRLGKVQANFEQRLQPGGRWQSNAHLDILD